MMAFSPHSIKQGGSSSKRGRTSSEFSTQWSNINSLHGLLLQQKKNCEWVIQFSHSQFADTERHQGVAVPSHSLRLDAQSAIKSPALEHVLTGC